MTEARHFRPDVIHGHMHEGALIGGALARGLMGKGHTVILGTRNTGKSETLALAQALEQLGVGLAIEHFGIGTHSSALLEQLPARFVKFHASYTRNFSDPATQRKMADLLSITRRRDIRTIASHVEDANVMARMWQLGINYIQGYHVQEPEAVLLSTCNRVEAVVSTRDEDVIARFLERVATLGADDLDGLAGRYGDGLGVALADRDRHIDRTAIAIGFLDVEGPFFNAAYIAEDFAPAGFSQVFGVAVNTTLYNALQAFQKTAAGGNIVPASCAATCASPPTRSAALTRSHNWRRCSK